ncbi:UNVERIFIED_CONTAM: hypothetical protein FKN15_052759, partial [Acipenser sinensis]
LPSLPLQKMFCLAYEVNVANRCILSAYLPTGLFPAILNLASNAEITANASCGESGPEMFCKLVEHVPGRPIRNPQCRVCDSTSPNPRERHPISNAIDGTNNWWQSPSIKNGRQNHWVTITLDLRQVFQVAYIIIKAANSPRPGNWILERSIDGIEFQPWQYHAISDTECLTRYNVTPRIGPPTYKRDDEVICTSYYSRLVPLEHGEIHTSLINGRPSADDLTPALLEFTSARYIRLRLQRIRTLNADLMTLSYRDPKDVDPIVTRRYYYSIKDISVGGMCICHGHAQSCPWDETTKKLQCVCEHNTCGESCNKCCPGYHQKPWKPGTLSVGNTCEKCNCHNKTEDCYYNQTVASSMMSMNIDGQFVGGGVCIDCTQNTAGINCETCVEGNYRPHKVLNIDDWLMPVRPIPITSGTRFDHGDSNQISKESKILPPQSSWSAPEGFLGNKLTAYGGYLNYTLSYDVPVESLHLQLKSNFDVVIEGNGKTLHTRFNAQLLLQPYKEQTVAVEMLPRNFMDFYTSRAIERDRLMTVLANLTRLQIRASFNNTSNAVLRQVKLSCSPGHYRVDGILFGGICQLCECNAHATECDIHGVCSDCKHNTIGPHCEQCMPGFYGDPSDGMPDDCQVCACPLNIPSNKCANGYYGDPTVPGELCVPCDCNGNVNPLEPGHCDTRTGECLKCVENTAGSHCERCADGYFGDAIVAKNCQDCGCRVNSSYSSVCDLESGKCKCRPNVTGEKCDQCLPGHFGLSSGLGCQTCNCNLAGSLSDTCDDEGQCPCVPGVAGEKCDRCAHGFYDFQDDGCTPCDCAHTHNNCNTETGQCICPPHTAGVKCELCEANHWGHDSKLGCKPCDCSLVGSSSSQCDLSSGWCQCNSEFGAEKCNECALGFRAYPECTACNCNIIGTREEYCDEKQGVCGCDEDSSTCSCKVNVVGPGCDECKLGTFALSADDPLGCRPCFCFGVSETCEELGGLVRIPIILTPDQETLHVVSQSDLSGTLDGVFLQSPDILLDAALVKQSLHTEPFYWRLPEQFQGNKECAPGFYRQSLTELNVRGPRPLIEPCVSCQCNNHSQTCDLDTGKCQGCQDNTAGDHCNLCAPGYYGKVRGSISDCSLCACPQGNTNSFSPTCVLEGVDDFRCNACMPGYEGQYCERCSLGYYGNPNEPSGSCQLCKCNPTGSVHNLCDKLTGHCVCKPGVRGLLCDECEPRHILMGTECMSCNDNCTGVLLNDLENLELSMQSVNLTGVILAPYSLLASLENTTDEIKQLEGHKDELALWNPKLRKQVDNLVMQMTKRSVLDLVYKAEDHAAGLKKLADSLHNALSGVRNVSFNATNAAQANSNIKINIEKAERLAEQANSTAAAAWSLALFSDCSLKDAGAKSLQQSSRLLSEAADLNNKTNGLISDLNGLKEQVDKIRHNAQNISKQLSEPLQLLSSIPSNVSVKVLEAKEHAMGANVSAVAALQHLEDFSQKLEESSSAMIRANETVKRTNELFSDSTKTANAAQKKVKEVETQTNLLFERLKPLKMLEDTLSRNLSEIKELIDQARKQAASIKVAVAAEQDCIRAYKPDISSSNYNTLTLIVKTSEPDNLLFYLGSSTNVDFMALEMRRGKVSFLWDVGSGFAKLEYPDIQINNDKWHRIHATRFGKTGSLTVQELKSSQTPTVKTATSPGTSTVLDVNKSTLVFVGGLGGQIKKSSAVKMTHFKGCMGGASLNGNNIGLWNYAEREGKCRGCFMSPQDEDTSFHFDGSGYSVVEKALRSTVTQIVMLFKTFSPNGLLLYLASNGTRDFTSIELVDGKVRLTFELGSGPLSLITDKTYNSGNWYKIAFHRTKQKGYLAVMDAYIPTNRETKEGTTSGSASDLNRSDKDPIYIGGLPRSRPVRRQLVTRSYVGCIKNLEIARSNFDLLKESYGVKKGCVLEPIRSVTILNEGFLELHPMSLAPESELMATFSTKNDTGIILAGISKGGKRRRRQTHLPFFAVMLINGQVEVHMNTGEKGHTRKAVVKSPAGTYSDGEDHSVILHRSKRLLTVQVDEGSLTEMRLAPSAESSPLNVSSFYIGGVPPGDGADMLKTGKSFYGCIRNMGYNMELLDLTTAVSYHNVDMDSCLLEERPKPVIQPEEGDLESELQPSPTPARPVSTIEQSSKTQGPAKCVEEEIPAIVPNAHQFGLTKTSHMALSFDESTVKTDFAKKKATITVDEKESSPVEAVGEGNTLDVEGKLYLGGLPLDFTAKKIGNVTHSVPACINNVMLNNKPLDQDNPISVYAVNRCYETAQEGTHFDGTGFAALAKGYKVRSDLIISFEFRTPLQNGVLLGISSAKVDAVGLELVSGKILFHVNNGAGRITTTYSPSDSSSLCDGKWHKLQANKSKHWFSLTIDGQTVRANNPYPQSTSAETNNPIYVGGFPADVKQNCLTIKTPFQGCMRSLRLVKGQHSEAYDFSGAFELRGVFPNSCPGAEH